MYDEPYIGEIRLMSFSFPPKGWAPCDGQLMPISQNQQLFSLLGTMYGGNGQTTFGLPDFRGRTPIHVKNGGDPGGKGGEQSHTLTVAELPQHTHVLFGSDTPAETGTPDGTTVLAVQANTYTPPSNLVTMAPASLTPAGSSQPHQNMQPYLTVSFCIALQGVFPSPIVKLRRPHGTALRR